MILSAPDDMDNVSVVKKVCMATIFLDINGCIGKLDHGNGDIDAVLKIDSKRLNLRTIK
jgi:hypothetical protein